MVRGGDELRVLWSIRGSDGVLLCPSVKLQAIGDWGLPCCFQAFFEGFSGFRRREDRFWMGKMVRNALQQIIKNTISKTREEAEKFRCPLFGSGRRDRWTATGEVMGKVRRVDEISIVHPKPLPELTETQTTTSLLHGTAYPSSEEP